MREFLIGLLISSVVVIVYSIHKAIQRRADGLHARIIRQIEHDLRDPE